MEETMNILTLWELRRYSRAALFELYRLIVADHATYAEGSFEQQIAATNLRNIRYVLMTYHTYRPAPH
jgi:hypothetical protein